MSKGPNQLAITFERGQSASWTLTLRSAELSVQYADGAVRPMGERKVPRREAGSGGAPSSLASVFVPGRSHEGHAL